MIQNYNADKVSLFVLGGGSAGALGAYNLANFFYDNLPNKEALRVAPDSGFFLDWDKAEPAFTAEVNTIMGIVMTDSVDLYPACVAKYNSREKCVFPQYYLDLIKAPLFVIESEYDQWSLSFIVGTMCQNVNLSLKSCNSLSMKRIEDYRTSFMRIINPIVPLKPTWGYWIIACVKHVFDQSESFFSGNYEVSMDSGWTLSDALN
jgi:hypothetical protein